MKKNAKEVISFIKEYCNRDKRRFILISTHQYKLIEGDIDMKINIESQNPLLSIIKTN